MDKGTGVYVTKKKNGEPSYRASITYRRKHISLGSFSEYELAQAAYEDAKKIIADTSIEVDGYKDMTIGYDKFISLVNFRDNGLYIANPIYIRKKYFEYYLAEDRILKFDRDDLFFYAAKKIQQKGGYLFVSDYGSQYKILSRYGIRPFAVYGRDFVMINNDKDDYRYSNIKIINPYTGVTKVDTDKRSYYEAKIHINGNIIIGRYDEEIKAAIAYNKAVDVLGSQGIDRAYNKNYIAQLKKEEYLKIYNTVKISDKLSNYKG